MRFSTNCSTWTSWEPYATSKAWTLTAGDGEKTVCVQYKDNTENVSSCYCDTIVLDTTGPSGSVIINNGDPVTGSASVTLTLWATDAGCGVSGMRLGNEGPSWTQWENYATSRDWTLTPGDGEKLVYAQFRDVLGIPSAVYSDSITLDSCVPPEVTSHPGNQEECVGQSAQFCVVATGTAPLNYQWSKNAVDIPGAESDCYDIASVVCADAGAYTCTVTNSCGFVTSDAATLTVNALPQIDTHPQSQAACVGDMAEFCVSASADCGTLSLSYQWRKDSTPIPGANAECYTIPSAVAGDAGTYTCIVTNDCGSATSDPADLAVGVGTTIVQAKQTPDDQQTAVCLKARTIAAAFDDFFYIESDNRLSGIRVDKAAHGLSVGMRADVTGIIKTNADGERYVEATWAGENGTGGVAPLGLNNKAVGGMDWLYESATGAGQRGVAGAYGLNNIGILIRTSGAFAYVDEHTFTIDDGSGVNVKCVVPAGVVVNPDWSYVVVTGISSCEKVGEELHRLI